LSRNSSQRLELLVPLAAAQSKVREQIARGEQLHSARITSKSALREQDDAKDRWTNFNIELMKQLLSGPEYSDQYQKFHSSISYPDWSLADEIEFFRAVVAEQTNQLKSDLERLTLMPEPSPRTAPPAGVPPTIHNIFNGPVGSVAQQSRDFHQTAVGADPTENKSPKSGLSGEAKIALATLIVTVLGVVAAWLVVPGFLK
jgi:hypothetical protein